MPHLGAGEAHPTVSPGPWGSSPCPLCPAPTSSHNRIISMGNRGSRKPGGSLATTPGQTLRPFIGQTPTGQVDGSRAPALSWGGSDWLTSFQTIKPPGSGEWGLDQRLPLQERGVARYRHLVAASCLVVETPSLCRAHPGCFSGKQASRVTGQSTSRCPTESWAP